MLRRVRSMLSILRTIGIYAVISLSILSLMFIAYGKTVEALRERLVQYVLLNMEHGLALFHEDLLNAYLGLQSVAQDPNVKSLAAKQSAYAPQDYYKMIRLRDALSKCKIITPLVYDCYFVIGGQLIISPDRIIDDFWGNYMRKMIGSEQMSASQFQTLISGDALNYGLNSGVYHEALALYTQQGNTLLTVPLVVSLSQSAQALRGVILIDLYALQNMLYPTIEDAELYLCFQGRQLTSGASNLSLPGKDGVVVRDGKTIMTMTSLLTDLRVHVAFPESYLTDQLISYQMLQMLFLAASVALCGGMVYALFWRIIRPLNKLSGAAEHQPPDQAIRAIAGTLTDLGNQNKRLSEQINTILPTFRQNKLYQIFAGIENSEALLADFPELREMTGGVYRIALLHRDAALPESEMLVNLREVLPLASDAPLIEPLSICPGLYALIYRNETRLHCAPTHCVVGISRAYTGVETIHQAYAEANRTLVNAQINGQTLLYSDDPLCDTPRYRVPYGQLERIATLIISAQSEEAFAQLTALVRQETEQSEARMLLHYELQAMFARVSSALGVNIAQRFPDWRENESTETLMSGCQIALNNARDIAKCQVESLLVEFVRTNSARQDMSLKLLSQEFHMNEKYISQYFKDHVGAMFSEYLETLRLKQAEDLLEDSACSCAEIACAVGYASADTFARAFKRKHGVAPGLWRSAVAAGASVWEK